MAVMVYWQGTEMPVGSDTIKESSMAEAFLNPIVVDEIHWSITTLESPSRGRI